MTFDQSEISRRDRILLVDDEPAILYGLEGVLAGAGYDVTCAYDGREALELLGQRPFDVVLSDIVMPDLDGIQLLRAMREQDLDLMVILMTGSASVDTAVKAVEYGALRYLLKPVSPRNVEEAVAHACRLRRMAEAKRHAFELLGSAKDPAADRAGLEVVFERALNALWMASQPIVHWSEKRIPYYEELLRTDEPSFLYPGPMLEAAEKLGRVHDLGRAVRGAVARWFTSTAPCDKVFINLHPLDLLDEELFSATAPLSHMADRAVLEITERASLDPIRDIGRRVNDLKRMGFQLALDDLGAGYAGLSTFTKIQPDIVKIDATLVRGVDSDVTRQKLVGSMTTLCRDMGMIVVAEGIETVGERDMVVALGCDLLQGYLFAKPGRTPPRPELE